MKGISPASLNSEASFSKKFEDGFEPRVIPFVGVGRMHGLASRHHCLGVPFFVEVKVGRKGELPLNYIALPHDHIGRYEAYKQGGTGGRSVPVAEVYRADSAQRRRRASLCRRPAGRYIYAYLRAIEAVPR